MPLSIQIALYVFYAAVLLYVSWTDIRARRIPNKVVGPAILVALIAMASRLGPDSALLGAIFGPLPLILGRLCTRAGRAGMGDIKLAIFIGLILGYPLVLWGVTLGLILFLGMALVGIARGAYTPRTRLPFGPFLAAGTLPLLLLAGLPV